MRPRSFFPSAIFIRIAESLAPAQRCPSVRDRIAGEPDYRCYKHVRERAPRYCDVGTYKMGAAVSRASVRHRSRDPNSRRSSRVAFEPRCRFSRSVFVPLQRRSLRSACDPRPFLFDSLDDREVYRSWRSFYKLANRGRSARRH